jgi:hypothetical protein
MLNVDEKEDVMSPLARRCDTDAKSPIFLSSFQSTEEEESQSQQEPGPSRDRGPVSLLHDEE